VKAVISLGHNIWGYAYMRMLYNKNMDIYYGALLKQPSMLLPVVYTPTVGEACQKFGKMPFSRRGCYVSIKDRGNIKALLEEYAAEQLSKGPDGKYLCDCIVFSDGGRILGLGDLGAWGMGIPIGKLDLYTVCAGVNPHRTIPVIIDAGCADSTGNTDKVVVRDHPLYTGLKQDRVKHQSAAGTAVNSAYYGEGNMIKEFMDAATEVFGKNVLLQFEDFNSNDAFPLLAEYRDKYLTYNDDIQGSAAVAVAGLLGAVKLQKPECQDLIGELRKQTFLFHGAGSANLGTVALLADEAGVPRSQIFVTNSRGVIWMSADGKEGSFRNDEQKAFAQIGRPGFKQDLKSIVEAVRPSVLIGAVGRDPGCFSKAVIEALCKFNPIQRPVVFAMSNPKTQAEITSKNAYTWSEGRVIYGSGTQMEPVEIAGHLHQPGQTNNIYIFPGTSMGAVCCKARCIPERLFMVAAEAVAKSLDETELKADRVVPHPERLREVGLNVAVAIALECQKLGLADHVLGADEAEVKEAVQSMMWSPQPSAPAMPVGDGCTTGIFSAMYNMFLGSNVLSLPKSVNAAGGIEAWNVRSDLSQLLPMLQTVCNPRTVDEALTQVKAVISLGHNIWGYAYMRMLYNKNMDIYYGALLKQPSMLLPVVYTPTVGEACQKFGKMPFSRRGCYVSIKDRGNIKALLEEYAAEQLSKGPDGKYLCDCIVFSDGGRILGLGDLGAWGMGIPIGKLDLYTVCAGVNPHRTIPVIIDAGCADSTGNTDKVVVRDHPLYTGLKQDRVKHQSAAGTAVNSAYYGEGNMIKEFMDAATEVFGKNVLLQFEDFNSNDAFPLLAEYRDKYLTYNDDIQGSAAVAVAGLLGAVKLQKPECQDLIGELRKQTFLFHGAGSANLGTVALLADEAGVPRSQIFVTNSRGVIWMSADGKEGSFRNDEQKAFAQIGRPGFKQDLKSIVEAVRPSVLIGAVGRDPGCFSKAVIEALCKFNPIQRPVVFAMSNPKTQAEITSKNAYTWSEGRVIYGSGTQMEPVEIAGHLHQPGQTNNIYIFPGTSMGAVCCKARCIPERLFMVAAEAVAKSLDETELKADRVVPHPERLREVGLNVAVAIALECQKLGLADHVLGADEAEVAEAIRGMMWVPPMQAKGGRTEDSTDPHMNVSPALGA